MMTTTDQTGPAPAAVDHTLYRTLVRVVDFHGDTIGLLIPAWNPQVRVPFDRANVHIPRWLWGKEPGYRFWAMAPILVTDPADLWLANCEHDPRTADQQAADLNAAGGGGGADLAPTLDGAVVALAARVTAWLDTTNGHDRQEVMLRVFKGAEELGEACDNLLDVGGEEGRRAAADEAADVVISVVTAQASLGASPTIQLSWLPAAESYQPDGAAQAALRVTSAVGRIVGVVIGWVGQNPRKGRTHTDADVARHLAEVVSRAAHLIALLGFNPAATIAASVARVSARLDALGVPA